MKSFFYKTCCILLLSQVSFAQNTLFNTIEHLDINKIKITACVHGDINFEPAGSSMGCEFPKGSGKHISHSSGIWMSGPDAQNHLAVSAHTFRTIGADFWPGPIIMNGSISYNESQKWAKVWKVNRSEILQFLSQSSHTTANTPASILEWPAKGNVHAKGNSGASLTITEDAAPFTDLDNDDVYEPLDGEYPDMKGDQMLSGAKGT